MSSQYLNLEQEFTVGPVRVRVWTVPRQVDRTRVIEQHRLTIDRVKKDTYGHVRYEDALESSDISKAIMALKMAHDYLVSGRTIANDQHGSRSDPAKVPERIP